MSRGTRHRTIRIDDVLWTAATEAAEDEDSTVSEVIRDFLTAWLLGKGRPVS